MEQSHESIGGQPAVREGRRGAWRWSLGMMFGMLLAGFAPAAAFAATIPHGMLLASGGIPAVTYGSGNSALSAPVTTAMENIAATIRLVLGGTALVVILVAAIMQHAVQDERAKMRSKEMIAAAVVGLLVAAFAPQIVNFFANL